MAITKVKTVNKVEVYPPLDSSAESTSNNKWSRLWVEYKIVLDDTSDDELPVTSYTQKNLVRYNTDGSAYDFSREETYVKTLITALWT